MPTLSYEWVDVESPKPPIYVKHLKRFTNPANSRTEKLALNLVFEGNCSRQLPTKLHIEIKDCKGRVVFRYTESFNFLKCFIELLLFDRKRQNVYYVKLQENISTLNAEEDYFMTITSIYGPESVS